MSHTLLILNDGPYGTERSYNALRLAGVLAKRDGETIRVFLIGDAAVCSVAGQKVPKGYYNIEVMLRAVISRGAQVGVCGTCMDARGIDEDQLCKGTHRSTMGELAEWTQSADRVLVW